MSNLVVSPCSSPDLELEGALSAYSALGYTKFEVFTSWARSAFDIATDPGPYVALGRRYGMAFTSLHLPPVEEDMAQTLDRAVQAARFAQAVGASVVLFKAVSRPVYIQAARPFLDAIEGLGITPVLQNHYGTPISSLEDFREVLDGIGDLRMKTLLEVGHFHKAGVRWPEGYALLEGRIALVHLKDMIGPTPVPFGAGEVDFAGLFARLKTDGYNGDLVIEMEAESPDREQTLAWLGEGREFVETLWRQA
jgi:sugar phosphate isomerase/epimerase